MAGRYGFSAPVAPAQPPPSPVVAPAAVDPRLAATRSRRQITGQLVNNTNTVGITLVDNLDANWTSYMNLAATGNDYVLKLGTAVLVEADGDAIFAGVLQATSGWFSQSLAVGGASDPTTELFLVTSTNLDDAAILARVDADFLAVGVTSGTALVVQVDTAHAGGTTDWVGILVTPTKSGAGAASVLAGIKVESPGAISGTLTTQYGLWLTDVSQGTTNYAIYTGLGTVRFGGGLILPHASKSGNYTLTANDYFVTVTAACTMTLPAASSHTGRGYRIHADVDNVVVDDIEGVNFTLYAGETIDVYSNGSQWKV